MTTKTIAGTPVEVNQEGYFTNPDQWTKEIANEIASEENIHLTDEHFKVINFLRQSYKDGVALSLRRVGNSGTTTIKDFYRLFPGAPLKKAAKIAGIPKPASCI
jgi:dissimilatory sulfite reductase related protein